jgi:hypothetical protein
MRCSALFKRVDTGQFLSGRAATCEPDAQGVTRDRYRSKEREREAFVFEPGSARARKQFRTENYEIYSAIRV